MNEMKTLSLDGKTYDSFVDQTARAMAEQAGDKSIYITEKAIVLNGPVSARQMIKSGTITVMPEEADTPTSVRVEFDQEFSGIPTVAACPATMYTGNVSVGVSSITTTGFTLYMTRTTVYETKFMWIAVYQA